MPVIHTVSSGDPITAAWANSLVAEVNTKSASAFSTGAYVGISHRPFQMDSTPAFQICYAKNGSITLNTGQIYIDGKLVASSENSYNQAGSIEDWTKYSVYKRQSIDDLPVWTIYVLRNGNGEYKAKLTVSKSDTTPAAPSLEGYELFAVIPINKVDKEKKEILQLVSGSIYLSTSGYISLIQGDGIVISKNTLDGVTNYTVSAYISLIGGDGIQITRESTQSGDNQIIFKVNNTHKYISFIEGDGIIITKDSNDDTTDFYTISTQSAIEIKEGDNITVTKESDAIYKIDGKNTVVKGENGVNVVESINNNTTVYTITADIDPGDVVTSTVSEGNGIDVTQTGNNYKVSAKLSLIGEDGISVTQVVESDGQITATISGGSSGDYTFDEHWFIVTDGEVTINEEAVAALIDEAVSDISVDVTAEGLIESNTHGNLRVTTTGLNSLTNLSADSTVAYA